jgi:hypothetical protein
VAAAAAARALNARKCYIARKGRLSSTSLQVVRDINERQSKELTDAAEEAKRLREQVGQLHPAAVVAAAAAAAAAASKLYKSALCAAHNQVPPDAAAPLPPLP